MRTIKEIFNSLTKRFIPTSAFARGAGMLVTGTAAGQIVVVLASPVLTRLYTPDNFGILAVYASLLNVCVVVASLRYELAIPLPVTNGSAANILALSFLCSSATSLIVFLVVILGGDKITKFTHTQVLNAFLWLLPVGVVLAGAYQSFNYWAIRKKAFGRIAQTKFQQSLGMMGIQVGVGLFQANPLTLLAGHIAGQASGLINLLKLAIKEDRNDLKRIRYKRVCWAAKRYKEFPIYSTFAAFANTFSSELPPILFASFFSPATAGIYLITVRVIGAPLSLLGTAIGQVFHSRAAESSRLNALPSIILPSFEALSRIFISPLFVAAVAAPHIFSFIFGQRWQDAGVYFQFLAPMVMVSSVFSPLSILGSILEKLRIVLVFQLALMSVRIAGIFAGYFTNSVFVALFCFSGFSVVVYILWIKWIFGEAGVGFRDIASIFMKDVTTGLVVSILVIYPGILISSTYLNVDIFQQDAIVSILSFLTISILIYVRSIPYLKNMKI